MIELKRAIIIALDFVTDTLFEIQQGIDQEDTMFRIEGIESNSDEWIITLSWKDVAYKLQLSGFAQLTAAQEQSRAYKEFTISKESGEIISMRSVDR